MQRRNFIHSAFLGAAAVGLPGCTLGPLDTSALIPNSPTPSLIGRRDGENGDVELILNTVDIWDSEGAGQPEELSVEGRKLYFRVRPVSLFEQPWMRVGLFWNSRQKKIMLTTVVLGPPVKIRKLRLIAGNYSTSTPPAKNFQFAPEQRTLDKELSSQAFAVKPSIIYAAAESKKATITLFTNRGGITGDLLAVPDTSLSALLGSPRYLFSEFVSQQRQVAAAG